ncbi:hypothetical protein [Clostridium sp.]|uniref:hypothetical protein n=1 Tax=Clostridium sp. TaxID=1506 RepID=UPI00262DEEA8|nr:hypothetical protein [Clostridium sp.]
MSVSICLHRDHKNVEEWLGMSNGGMAVFLTVIVLSGSRLAIKKKEKEIIQWFVEQDDTVRGRGCNGFDICDIPWEKETFEKERQFLLKVLDGAKAKLGWEVLSYQPNEDFVFRYLEKFETLLLNFTSEYIDENTYSLWLEDNKILEFLVPKDCSDCDEKSKELALKARHHFEELIIKFKNYIDDDKYDDWAKKQKFPILEVPDGFHICKEHGAIISWNGCIVCNDM